MFTKQSTWLSNESGSSNDQPRQSNAWRRSTQCRSEPKNCTTIFGEYEGVVDDELHMSNPSGSNDSVRLLHRLSGEDD